MINGLVADCNRLVGELPPPAPSLRFLDLKKRLIKMGSVKVPPVPTLTPFAALGGTHVTPPKKVNCRPFDALGGGSFVTLPPLLRHGRPTLDLFFLRPLSASALSGQ